MGMRTKRKGETVSSEQTKAIYIRVTEKEHDAIVSRVRKDGLKSVTNVGRNLILEWALGKAKTP